jgi:hypothetical protein
MRLENCVSDLDMNWGVSRLRAGEVTLVDTARQGWPTHCTGMDMDDQRSAAM